MSSYHGPGTYYIVNSKANTSVDLLDGNPKPGVQINGWESVNGNPHQIWLIADRGLGEVIILNYNTGSYIAAPAGLKPGENPSPDTKARTVGGPGSPNDPLNRWVVKPESDGSVTFASVAYPTKVLDLSNGDSKNATPVLAWEGHETSNQRWNLKPVF